MTTKSLYLNHAGTSWPLPSLVKDAINAELSRAPTEWSATFEEARRKVASFFGVSDVSTLLPTPGGTSAISTAIQDIGLSPNDRVLTSRFEHHAMHRPLLQIAERGVRLDYIPYTSRTPIDLDALERELAKGDVSLVAMTSACNVTGDLLPTLDVIEIAHDYGANVMIDASQTVGWIDTNIEELGPDVLAFAGHKGLQTSWGLGFLYMSPNVEMMAPAATCTIGNEASCNAQPSYCDVGSVDRLALAGAAAAVDWLRQPEQTDRLSKARAITRRIHDAIDANTRSRLVGYQAAERKLPTVAFVVEGMASNEVSAALSQHGIIVASGYQCAPLAHESFGTSESGVVRVSVGPDQDGSAPDQFIDALTKIT